jgi:DNA-directed RNA polymerase subunit RPC12/RpoP
MDDQFTFRCPCGRSLKIPSDKEGRKIRCPACRTVSVAIKPSVTVYYESGLEPETKAQRRDKRQKAREKRRTGKAAAEEYWRQKAQEKEEEERQAREEVEAREREVKEAEERSRLAELQEEEARRSEELREQEARDRVIDSHVSHFFSEAVRVEFENADGTKRQEIIRAMHAGEVLHIERERGNKYDPNALSLSRMDGQQIGYLAPDDATKLVNGMDDDHVYFGYAAQITEISNIQHGVIVLILDAPPDLDPPATMDEANRYAARVLKKGTHPAQSE